MRVTGGTSWVHLETPDHRHFHVPPVTSFFGFLVGASTVRPYLTLFPDLSVINSFNTTAFHLFSCYYLIDIHFSNVHYLVIFTNEFGWDRTADLLRAKQALSPNDPQDLLTTAWYDHTQLPSPGDPANSSGILPYDFTPTVYPTLGGCS